MGEVIIGGNTVTVYGTEDGLRSYWAVTLGGINSTDSKVQKQSLVAATRWMDTVGLCNPDTGQPIAPTSDDSGVPLQVIDGAYELANLLIANPSLTQDQDQGGTNIKVAGAGSARVEFFRPSDGAVFPPSALRILGPYLKGNKSVGSLFGCATGTDGESNFKDASFPELTEGFK